MNEELYSSREVSEMLGIKIQSVTTYFRKHGIGTKYGKSIMFTKEDVEKIRNTDNRRKP